MKNREQETGLQLATIAALPPEQRMAAAMAAVVPTTKMQALEVAYQLFGGCLADPTMSHAQRAVLTAAAATALRQALEGPVLEAAVMPLQNHPAGFDTDRNPNKGWNGEIYSKEIVLGCAVQAILTGLPLTGNVWNIIGGSFYVRKEGFEQLVASRCRYSILARVPIDAATKLYETGGYVSTPVTVLYQLFGDAEGSEPRKFTATYNLRLTRKNAVAPDYLEGKAKRKALRDLWGILSGQLLAEAGDEEEGRGFVAAARGGGVDGGGEVDAILSNKSAPPLVRVPEERLTALGDFAANEGGGFSWQEVSDACRKMHGVPPEELTGQTAAEAEAKLRKLIKSMPIDDEAFPERKAVRGLDAEQFDIPT